MAPKNRAKDNWAHWLHIHRLEAQFPELPRLTDSDFDRKFYQRPDNEVGVTNILAAISGAPRTLIQFTRGHGVTTMFRAVLRRLNSQPVRRLHVAIDIAEYLESEKDVGDVIWEEILWNVFRQLVSSNWYGQLYGMRQKSFQLVFDTTGYAQFTDYIDAMRVRLIRSKGGDRDALNSFRCQANLESLGTLFRTLLEKLGIETVLLFDVPHSASQDDLLSLMSEIKAFDEQVRAQGGYPPAAVTEVYFGTAASLRALEATYSRDYHRVEVPAYNPAEVFAILTNHYGVQHVMRPAESVISILSASYLDNVWSATKSLADMMQDLKGSLLKLLDCPRDKVSFGMFQDPTPTSGRQ
jgi:hypothetical protein